MKNPTPARQFQSALRAIKTSVGIVQRLRANEGTPEQVAAAAAKARAALDKAEALNPAFGRAFRAAADFRLIA